LYISCSCALLTRYISRQTSPANPRLQCT
jgi:hypothetical protein